MARAIVHKEGDRVLIEISAEDADAAGLEDGQVMEIPLPMSDVGDQLDPEIKAIAKRIIREHRDALDYLAQ
jgi:hypothetical protein